MRTRRGLIITDPIVHVATDADADLDNQTPDAECIDVHASLVSKYESQVLSATNTAIFWFASLPVEKNQIIMISYRVPKQRSAFVSFANLLVIESVFTARPHCLQCRALY